jgi:hypothetical protein
MQVEQLTLGEIASGAPAGSVLLYGRELLAQGLPCLLQPRLLESWGNGTNTEVRPHTLNVPELRPVQLPLCQHPFECLLSTHAYWAMLRYMYLHCIAQLLLRIMCNPVFCIIHQTWTLAGSETRLFQGFVFLLQ